MKFILLSDIHTSKDTPVGRTDDFPDTLRRKKRFIFDYARANGIKYIVQAGDWFDRPRSWLVLADEIDLFQSFPDVSVLLVYGQHDIYMREGLDTTILGVMLKTVPNLTLLQESPFVEGGTAFYGAGFGQDIPTPGDYQRTVLVTHRMILNNKFWKGQGNYDYAPEFLRKHPFDLILCGDAHQKFEFRVRDRYICNTGPLVRAEASRDMYDHAPGFFVWDDSVQLFRTVKGGWVGKQSLRWVEVPHEPAEKVLSRKHLEEGEHRNEVLERFIAGVQDVRGVAVPYGDMLEDLLKATNASRRVREIISNTMEGEGDGA